MTEFETDLQNLSDWFKLKHDIVLDKSDLEYLESKLRLVKAQGICEQIKAQLNDN